MPTFESAKGGHVWIPARAVLRAEAAPGGLTTQVILDPPAGTPPGSFIAVEVKGTVETIGRILDASLNPPSDRALLVGRE